MTDPREFDQHGGPTHGYERREPAPQQSGAPGYSPEGYDPQGYAPGYGAPQGYGPGVVGPQPPGVGSRLAAFVTRDTPALFAAVITIVAGLMLFVTPRLTWVKDSSFDMVDGTMTFTAHGAIDLSAMAQRTLSDSAAIELGFTEIMVKMLAEPFAAMLTLSAVLVLIGGGLMLTTARQLGAIVALLGVAPQVLITAFSTFAIAISTADDPPSPSAPTGGSGTEITVGVGLYLTLAAYVLVIVCVAVAALRREVGPPSADHQPQQGPGPGFEYQSEHSGRPQHPHEGYDRPPDTGPQQAGS